MGHGVPLATTSGRESYGAAGAFFLDVGISSTHYIARFWRLHEMLEAPRAAEGIAASVQAQSQGRSVVLAGAPEGAHASSEELLGEEDEGTSTPFGPNGVIAKAFKAAGLPNPEMPPGTAGRAGPGPIIAAALKAAGLVR
jgi:hypothetical protein